MTEQIQQRIEQLRQELESGQRLLSELDLRRADLRDSLLRVSGAIQALEELTIEPDIGQPAAAAHPVPA
jgi:prefoldin subunit 5